MLFEPQIPHLQIQLQTYFSCENDDIYTSLLTKAQIMGEMNGMLSGVHQSRRPRQAIVHP